ncbi:MAG TPA: hypothetical protein DCK95_08905 [Anaerolineaceae bacterium]|nr:hypothetical protein [Anaerolineaceae bacterium]
MAQSVNHEKLHKELKAAGLPVIGVSASGRVDYARALTLAEQESAKTIIAAHDLTPTDSVVFMEQLKLAGFTRDDVLYALWKSAAEGSNALVELIKSAL